MLVLRKGLPLKEKDKLLAFLKKRLFIQSLFFCATPTPPDESGPCAGASLFVQGLAFSKSHQIITRISGSLLVLLSLTEGN
jgi:hypothetical protein